ncbi:MAG TPA: Na+/H+ antiporter NhaA [Nitrospiraceae bacterium]|nr:Na+/H+ antiporter NhaA [Nitrospiraceae bacterium]
MAQTRPTKLDRPVDIHRDHVLGSPKADMTLVEYGSYTCPRCHAVHDVIAELRDRFGERLRYVFRHRPGTDDNEARQAAELAEYASETTGRFWEVHDTLMKRGPAFTSGDFERVAGEFSLPRNGGPDTPASQSAKRRVREDLDSAQRSGVLVTPTFFINNRRYEGPWDESALADALLGSLGHRMQTAALDFVRWGPSAGLLLLLMSVLAVVLSNSPLGPAVESWWRTPLGLHLGNGAFTLPLLDWINDGLLSVFFFVVGLEIKREFTVGHLATRQAAALPVMAAIGGIIFPALIYLLVIPPGPLRAGWAIPMLTDTAFAVALIVLLGDRVPVELRVFLTAAVIIDDLVAIIVIALFYSTEISMGYLVAAVAVTSLLAALNRWGVYRPLPYAVLGVILWVCVHDAGLHATLAGVILAVLTPTRPPANLPALMAQAEIVIQAETRRAGDTVMRRGPSEPALRALDAIHDRIESPAAKLLRSTEPWSSYVVLPVFALANAGIALSLDVFEGHGRLMLAIILGLVLGKPIGITLAARLAVLSGMAVKPDAYSWRQLAGAGALAGIGFTMSLFIAGEAFPNPTEYAAAKIAIFLASFAAGGVGTAILWTRQTDTADSGVTGTQAANSGSS